MFNRLRRHARPLARIGCVSIGTVYILLGTLALLALAGVLIEAADEDRMIYVIKGVPGGAVLIWGVIAGLTGYVVWRTVEVLADPYEFGTSPRGLAVRAGIGLSALAYGFVAFSAARIAAGYGGTDAQAAEQEQQMLVARALEWPGGRWLIGAIGVAGIVVALLQFVVVAKGAYATEFCLDDRGTAMRRLIRALAWYGYSARGIILGVLGYFFVRGAVADDPDGVGDTDTAFDFIGGGVIGDSAFFVVALGTVAYGLLMYINAWYYRFEKPRNETRRPAVADHKITGRAEDSL